MARKHEAAEWLRKGHSPAQIASMMGVSFQTVMDYLYNQIGEGSISRADVLFSIPEKARAAVEDILKTQGPSPPALIRIAEASLRKEVNYQEARLYMRLSQPLVYAPDMFFWISALETFMHRYIRHTLRKGFGNDWWRQGVPQKIREECAQALERDPEPAAEPFCYTTFIHLKEIFEKQWEIFRNLLPQGPVSDRRRFLADLTKLNSIRNRVMHPVKGQPPSEADFRFVREFVEFVEMDKWFRPPGSAELD